ncbi:MAG: hypothetical protein KDJ98_08180 [Rhodobacteraceae bacterium]|nr:hypothetical protein [Paracoccaceae bacterium]
MTAPARLAEAEMLDRAARAVGKVDLYGRRGATMVSLDEVEAMAITLALLGLRAIHPAAAEYAAPDTPLNPLKGPADV